MQERKMVGTVYVQLAETCLKLYSILLAGRQAGASDRLGVQSLSKTHTHCSLSPCIHAVHIEPNR